MSETIHTPDIADTTAPIADKGISEEKISALASAINFDDPALTISYGSKTMNEIAKFADDLLGNVRVKDAGPVGDSLQELMLKVKDIDVTEIASPKKSVLSSIPLIGSLFGSVEKTLARFDTLLDQVEGISAHLEDAMLGLLKDIQVLEQLYGYNQAFYEDLTAAIMAGERRLQKAREEELPRIEGEARKSGNALDAQKVHDFAERLNRFERRLHDLRLSRTITLQTAPQIRMIQSNNQTLAEKIQTSILATIPVWKNQLVLALSIHGQHKAAQLQKEVADTTNALLRKNAEMLQTSSTAAAREVERSIVDVETLRDVQSRLIATIEETMTIAREGRARRMEVERELVSMEENLKTKLTALAGQKNSDRAAILSGTRN